MSLTLYHGDCLEVMRDISSNSIDLIICDLPYGCFHDEKIRDNNSHYRTNCFWDKKIDLAVFWKEIKRIRRNNNTPTIHFCTTRFGYELIKSNEKEFRYDIIWDKQRGVSNLTANIKPMRGHEMMYVFSKTGAFYNRVDISGRCVTSVINIPKICKKGNHPTEKPTDLYKWLIERYCPEGGTVLDPTFGSGNSVFTAFSMGRTAIGIEKDDGFFKKAEERLNN